MAGAVPLGAAVPAPQLRFMARLSFLACDGSPRFHVSYETMRRLLGGRHFNFMRGDLERVLFDALARRAQVRFGSVRASSRSRRTILEPVGKDLWTIDGRVVRAYGFPFPTRMVVLLDGERHRSGDALVSLVAVAPRAAWQMRTGVAGRLAPFLPLP